MRFVVMYAKSKPPFARALLSHISPLSPLGLLESVCIRLKITRDGDLVTPEITYYHISHFNAQLICVQNLSCGHFGFPAVDSEYVKIVRGAFLSKQQCWCKLHNNSCTYSVICVLSCVKFSRRSISYNFE